MSMLIRFLAVAGLAVAVALPSLCLAEGPGDYEADARYAEQAPPLIPHRIGGDANGEVCLSCHRTGVNGAPLSPHPVRLYCTQCHVRSDTSDSLPAAKKGKARK